MCANVVTDVTGVHEMDLTTVATRVSDVLQFVLADGVERSLSRVRRSSATRGALMYSMKDKTFPCRS